MSRLFALVPAAGLSRRMGTPKLQLPIGNRTVLQQVLDPLIESLGCGRVFETHPTGLDAVFVILGQTTADLMSLVTPSAQAVLLTFDPLTMRDTIEAGLSEIERLHQPTAADAFLLALADQPTLSAEVVRTLIDHWRTEPTKQKIVLPTHAGKRGHPTIIPWSLVDELRRLPPDRGVNALLADPSRVLPIAMNMPNVLVDLDTPADYERLKSQWPQ